MEGVATPALSAPSMSSPSNTVTPVLSPEQLAENDSYVLMNTCIGLFVAMTVAVIMRIWSRRIAWAGWMWGDLLIPMSYLCMIGMIVCSISVLPKLAVLEVYVRFFVLDRVPRYLSYLCAAIMIINSIVNLPLVAAQCAPVAYLWDKSIAGGYCNNAQQHFLWGSVANVVTDLIMLILPMPLVFKLQSSARVKWGIFGTFLVGSIGLIFSILRFVGFDVAYQDGTFIAPTVIVSGLVEPAVYLIAACFLTYRPLFRWLVHTPPLAPIFSRISSTLSKHSNVSDSSARTGADGRLSAAWDGTWHRLEPVGRSSIQRDEETQAGGDDWQRQSQQIGVAVPMPAPDEEKRGKAKNKVGITVQPREEEDTEGEGLSFEEMMRAGPRR